jgi:hypothetical protein
MGVPTPDSHAALHVLPTSEQVSARAGILHPDDRLPVEPSTHFRDYILTAYEPRCDPRGRLHGASLLRHGLRASGLLEAAWPVCEALRRHLGPDETVWGLKEGPEGVTLELYFYNFDENASGNPKSVTALSRALAPLLRFDSHADERLSYFMCSFEIDAAALARHDGGSFRLYFGSGDRERRACGFSYRLRESELELENHYWFYKGDRPAEVEDAVRRVAASPRSGTRSAWRTLLPRYLRECFTICYAVKPKSDALYYARIDSGQLGRFLERHRPGALSAALRAHADDFAHLSWDLGFDFAAAPSAETMVIHKLGVHGVL